MPNILLVYPELPPSYWSHRYALEFIGRKASTPPLGLLTIAAHFPERYTLKLVDMNVEPLTDEHLAWSDLVCCSAMIVQRDSLRQVVARCNQRGVPVAAGGPYPTTFWEEITGVDHLVLGEAEDLLHSFLVDFEHGRARPIYRPATDAQGRSLKPDLSRCLPPRYDLIDLSRYGSVALQFSRGCPFDCEFCDITKLYGHAARTKSAAQMLAELDVLYDRRWRGTVFLVDDNFIGNRRSAQALLQAVARWQRERGYPFSFYTEASVNLARMPDLMRNMADAGFDMAFLGLETPNPKALLQANKVQNVRASDPDYLLRAVHTIQQHGMEVCGGFILGMDGDDESSFDAQIRFVQEAGIPTAMVGLLSVVKGTSLYERLQREGRLLEESDGNNVSLSVNFVPSMDRQALLRGYKRVLSTLYDPSLRNYFARCNRLLERWNRRSHCKRRIRREDVAALFKSLVRQIFSRQGPAYSAFLVRTLLRRPRMFSEAVRLAIMGYHYEKVARQQVKVDEFKTFLQIERERLNDSLAAFARMGSSRVAEARACLHERFACIQKRYDEIHFDFRGSLHGSLASFRESIEAQVALLFESFPIEVPQFGA